MTHASLFSGIGGFDLAAEWMGWENLFHCEWNPFGQRVLKHHFPKSISYNDITKTDFSIHRGQVDILTGGFPCQPYSQSGKRLGKEDERHLWPEMLRTIQEVQPRWVVGENVLGLVNWNGGLVFQEVQTDLEAKGYEVQAYVLPACAKNAPHRRDRVWFIAYNATDTNCNGFNKCNSKYAISTNDRGINALCNINKSDGNGIATNSKCAGLEYGNKTRNIRGKETKAQIKGCSIANEFKTNGNDKWESFPTKSPICGTDDGLPRELDGITFPKWRQESLRAYGNAIVPQVAYEIFKAIEKFELLKN